MENLRYYVIENVSDNRPIKYVSTDSELSVQFHRWDYQALGLLRNVRTLVVF